MKPEDYRKAIERWRKYKKRFSVYITRKRELIKRDASDAEFIKLEKDFGYGQDHFGPFTIIDDPIDLINPNFILPGFDTPFMSMTTDHNIPEYFGKTLHSDLSGEEGVVIGYGYDYTDDYIIIKDSDGKIHYILVNSKYHLV